MQIGHAFFQMYSVALGILFNYFVMKYLRYISNIFKKKLITKKYKLMFQFSTLKNVIVSSSLYCVFSLLIVRPIESKALCDFVYMLYYKL